MLYFTVGPTWVGALVALCDNHPGHGDCMFLLCEAGDGIVLKSAPLRWETEKIAGCQISVWGMVQHFLSGTSAASSKSAGSFVVRHYCGGESHHY